MYPKWGIAERLSCRARGLDCDAPTQGMFFFIARIYVPELLQNSENCNLGRAALCDKDVEKRWRLTRDSRILEYVVKVIWQGIDEQDRSRLGRRQHSSQSACTLNIGQKEL